MQPTTDFFLDLRDALAGEFYQRESIEAMVVADLGIDGGIVSWDSMARNTWTSAVALAERQGKIMKLLELAIQRQSYNPLFKRLRKTYEQENKAIVAGNPRFHYIPYAPGSTCKVIICYDGSEQAEARKLTNQLSVYTSERHLDLVDWWQAEATGFHLLAMLITPSLVGSNIPYLPFAQKVMDQGGRVIPVLCKSCEWERVKMFTGKVPLPVNRAFVSDKKVWPDEDQAYRVVANGIAAVVDRIKIPKK